MTSSRHPDAPETESGRINTVLEQDSEYAFTLVLLMQTVESSNLDWGDGSVSKSHCCASPWT